MFNSKVHKFFTLAKFRNVTNWSVSHILGMNVGFNEKYPMVMIGDIITRSAETVNIEDDKDYRQVTLKTNGGGAVQRKDGIKKGKEIGTKKQYIVHTDQFIMSKIDARNGAFGVIGSDLEGSIVTADFPVFDVDKSKVLPEYLKLISSTSRFVEFAKSCSSGTTNRQRIDVKQFLLQQIPLPSLDVQKRLVASYNNKLQQAEDFELKTQELKKKIEDYLQKTLGVSSPKGSSETEKNSSSQKCRFLNFVKFKNVDRWDCLNDRRIKQNSSYETVSLSQIIVSKPQYGAGYSAKEFDDDVRYIRITDINEDGFLNDKKVSAAEFSESYLLKDDDFLIARSGNTVGKTFLYKNEMGRAIYAGYLIRFELDKTKVNPEYLLAYTKSSIYKKWIDVNMRVSAQPNINSQQYLDSPVILPPIGIQKSIVKIINKPKEQIVHLKLEKEKLLKIALRNFEQEVFV